ncbi:MAG TPA: polyhydroxyalkanoate synthesis regulator DNA-binding domain-containing protein [Bryobacteraceae bacterium]|nr:polyhydroxyalkanoate synthesis regulator DNA-binding domain-containing protein [Bryobacteraceae bacterium]
MAVKGEFAFMETGRVVIRKYENRRLYDTANSRYVNLDDIAQMVRDGVDVQVVDAASGEDLTRLVLTQIIVEDVKAPGSGFPLDVLRQMVVASGRVSRETVVKYTKAMFDMYQNTYRAFTPGLTPFDFMQSIMGTAAPQQREAERKPEPSAPAPAVDAAAAIDEMRRRIEELERQVAAGAQPPSRKKRGGPKQRRGRS